METSMRPPPLFHAHQHVNYVKFTPPTAVCTNGSMIVQMNFNYSIVFEVIFGPTRQRWCTHRHSDRKWRMCKRTRRAGFLWHETA